MKPSIAEALLKNKLQLLFYLLLLLVLVDRTNTLIRFSFIYTDSDQTILWLSTQDLSEGKFQGPCFYGQSYNPLIESFLAVPLVKAGLSYPIALPLITSVLSIVPFILLAFHYKKKSGAVYGLLPFLFLLLLSPEYGMLSSMPRGFVTGIFFGALGLVCLLKDNKWFDLTGSFLLAIAIFANPNSILLFPLVIPSLVNSSRPFKSKIGYLMIGGMAGLIPQILNTWYYSTHPELVVHSSPDMGLSLDSFSYVIQHLAIYFDWVTPVFWKLGWISLLFFPFAIWKLNKHEQRGYVYTITFLLVLILFSFFSNKVKDGRDSIYFAGARMFLAFPVILLVVTTWLLPFIKERIRFSILLFLVIVSMVSVSVKLVSFDLFVQNQIRSKDYTVVGTTKVNDLRNTCFQMMQFGNGSTDLIIANSANSSDQLITYGCGCLVKDFPPTLQPEYDRRTWLWNDLVNQEYHQVLIHGEEIKVWDTIDRKNIIILQEDPDRHWILVKNSQNIRDLMKSMNLLR